MENKTLSKEHYERFMSFVKKQQNGCWEWQGYLDKDGYGTFLLLRKPRRAHRVSYYAHCGKKPDKLTVHHKCKNTSCVNPKHLELMTKKENNLLSNNVGAINARKTHCKNGHKFNKKYGKQRYCSICQSEKTKRLRIKWNKKLLLEGV